MQRTNLWLTLAATTTLVSGCLSAPAILQTQMPAYVGEVYGSNSNPPVYQEAIPPGQPVTLPRGRAALTLYIVIPHKDVADPSMGDRQTQYVDYNATRKVDVTITGENLASPVTTSINISSGTSAAGTVIVTPGRNQIITAVAKDATGNVLATVKGVATSLPGQVVNAVAQFGTTPLATVISGLSATDAPGINPTAISAVIDSITKPVTSGGKTTYGTHPLFVSTPPLVGAINSIIAAGTASTAISSADIYARVATNSLKIAPGTVRMRYVDANGVVKAPPASRTLDRYYRPYDRNGDGLPDGSYPSGATSASIWYLELYSINDPLSPAPTNLYYNNMHSGYHDISGVPEGTYVVSWRQPWNNSSSYSVFSDFPWWVPAIASTASVTVASGSITTFDYRLYDVSKEATMSAGAGSFVGKIYEWYKVPIAANMVYTFNLARKAAGTFRLADYQGNQLFFSSSATDSYTFASDATNSVYINIPSENATVSITSQTLTAAQSLYNATLNFAQ